MYNAHVGLETYHLRSYLTDIFTVLSFEDLEQVSGGGMIWLVDDKHWTWPYAYSIATDQKTILADVTRRDSGVGY